MWGMNPNGSNWNNHQSQFENMSYDSIDWANLAKQWIQHKDTNDSNTMDQTNITTSAPPQNNFVASQNFSINSQFDNNNDLNNFNIDQNYVKAPMSQNFNIDTTFENHIQQDLHNPTIDSWNMPAWAVPPPPPPPEENKYVESKFSGYWDQNSIDPHIMNNVQVPCIPKFNERPRFVQTPHIPMNQNWIPFIKVNNNSTDDAFFMDASKKRHLPAWIREGLEKMEKQKLKEKEDKERESNIKNIKPLDKNVIIDQPLFKDDKFNKEDNVSESLTKNEFIFKSSVNENFLIQKKSYNKIDILKSEQPELDLITMVKLMLTEILLDVTKNEILDIAKSVHKKAKLKMPKAPVRQIVMSSALTSISILSSTYGSGSGSEDESEIDDAKDDSMEQSSDNSDVEIVQQKIKLKKLEFEKKMRYLDENKDNKLKDTNKIEKSEKNLSQDIEKLKQDEKLTLSKTSIKKIKNKNDNHSRSTSTSSDSDSISEDSISSTNNNKSNKLNKNYGSKNKHKNKDEISEVQNKSKKQKDLNRKSSSSDEEEYKYSKEKINNNERFSQSKQDDEELETVIKYKNKLIQLTGDSNKTDVNFEEGSNFKRKKADELNNKSSTSKKIREDSSFLKNSKNYNINSIDIANTKYIIDKESSSKKSKTFDKYESSNSKKVSKFSKEHRKSYSSNSSSPEIKKKKINKYKAEEKSEEKEFKNVDLKKNILNTPINYVKNNEIIIKKSKLFNDSDDKSYNSKKINSEDDTIANAKYEYETTHKRKSIYNHENIKISKDIKLPSDKSERIKEKKESNEISNKKESNEISNKKYKKKITS